MSRIGKKPIALPSGVKFDQADGLVTVKGPKGELKLHTRPEIGVVIEEKQVLVENNRPERDRQARAYHGLTRALLNNMVIGVSAGFERKLEINGVGYTAKLEGNKIVLSLGFAHTIAVDVPANLEVECPSQTQIVVRGCDKQAVGELAAKIRKLRPPEPYKGKGIKYDFEVIRRKAGKAFASGG